MVIRWGVFSYYTEIQAKDELHPMVHDVQISIVVPAYNDPESLRECLAALQATAPAAAEIIVVDDASSDETPTVAARAGVILLRLPRNSGPAAARNYGAQHAQGDILFFVDADVVVAPNTITQVLAVFTQHRDIAAVFGSYDAQPRAQDVMSQYRNLLHHFVHTHGDPNASTFWAGCGAIRRAVFFAVGGFDERRFPRPSVEDIELGYRLRQAGYRILLDKSLQGTHLKRWTLRSVIWTDTACRAIPWSQLMLTSKETVSDLNVSSGQRLSVALVGLALAALLGALAYPQLLVLALAALVGVGVINRALYAFFYQRRGLLFAAACVLFHLLHYVCSGIGYGYAWWEVQVRRKTIPMLPDPTHRHL